MLNSEGPVVIRYVRRWFGRRAVRRALIASVGVTMLTTVWIAPGNERLDTTLRLLCLAGLFAIVVASPLLRRWNSAGRELPLDERQKQVSAKTLQDAYLCVCGAAGVVLLWMVYRRSSEIGVTLTAETAMHLALLALLVITVLPFALIAWREPDPVEPDEFSAGGLQ